jgi:hypothetical protein
MVALFQKTKQNISLHINNIFHEGELDEDSVSSFLEHTAADGKTYKTRFYNIAALLQASSSPRLAATPLPFTNIFCIILA